MENQWGKFTNVNPILELQLLIIGSFTYIVDRSCYAEQDWADSAKFQLAQIFLNGS